MATRTNNEVTLSHEDAKAIARLLQDYEENQRNNARRTRSEQAKYSYNITANAARYHSESIVRRLWSWSPNETERAK